MTNIKPAEGRILIKKLDRKDVTTNTGVLIPGQTLQEENLLYGEIIKGNDKYTKGLKVYYSRYSSTMVIDDKGNQYYILSDLDVMAYDSATV